MIAVAASLWSVPEPDQLTVADSLAHTGIQRLHWDMSDGTYAARGGFSADRAAEITFAMGLSAEAHIMAVDSSREVDAWTDFCDLVIVHAETHEWRAAVRRIERRGCTPGIAIAPGSATDVAPRDMTVLCMSVAPGTAGSSFDPRTPERVATLRAEAPDRVIGVDGGVQRRHAGSLAAAGADWLVVGTDLVFGGASRWKDLLSRGV